MLSGFVASEWLGDVGAWNWELDGLIFLPALIGSIVVGHLAEFVIRIVAPTPQMPPTTGHRYQRSEGA